MPTQSESRIHKSIMNAKVNLVFYFLILGITFFSRKIFLDTLGPQFFGLTGALGNILGFLNLAELGIGASVSFALYKPLQEGSREAITDIVSVFGYYYRFVGKIILAIGLGISLFFPYIFRNEGFSLWLIYFTFFSFLISNLIGYFVNFRQVLLSADQRNYVVTVYSQTANIIRLALQIYIAVTLANLYLWVAIELIFGIVYALILNWRIRVTYPWLHATIKRGQSVRKHYPWILTKTKQIFVHKIKDFVIQQCDQIFIFVFVSLQTVAYYGNYIMVITKVQQLFNQVLDGMFASVGNLVAEGNPVTIKRVFWELLCLRYFIGGFVVFSVSQLIQPFIILWLGHQYLLSELVLTIILINTYIILTRGVVDMFNNAYGNYADTWSAWAEGIIFIVATVILGWLYGLPGILLGKVISQIPIIVIWKPLYLYRQGFHAKIRNYWLGVLRYYAIFAVCFFIAYRLKQFIPFSPYENFSGWIGYSMLLCVGFLMVFIPSLYFFAPGGKSFAQRITIRFKRFK